MSPCVRGFRMPWRQRNENNDLLLMRKDSLAWPYIATTTHMPGLPKTQPSTRVRDMREAIRRTPQRQRQVLLTKVRWL